MKNTDLNVSFRSNITSRTDQDKFHSTLPISLAAICSILILSFFSHQVIAIPFGSGHAVNDNYDGAYSVYAVDIDSDGDLDLIGAARSINAVTWWENTAGDGSFWLVHAIDNNFVYSIEVYAADLDGDGDPDVLGAAMTGDDITWWENTAGDGSAWSEHLVDGAFNGARSVHAADVDKDGDLDILGAARYDDDVAWWENLNGDGSSWDKHVLDENFDGADSIYAADVDGDGDLDVLGAGENEPFTWWENLNGDGSDWTAHAVVGIDDRQPGGIFAADVDSDGDIDILGAEITADDITWWENTAGDGSAWSEHIVDGDFGGAHSVYTADVDDDGDLDILGAANYDDEITWWENSAGDGSVWIEHIVDDSFDGANTVTAADVDGDGDLDILGAASIDDDITWWENIALTGDLDEDGDVDLVDLSIMAGNWLKSIVP